MHGLGPKIHLKSPLAPQPVPQKLDSVPPSKGPFSVNIHPIIPKLSVPIPEGMCFRKMVGGPLRKWTLRGQKSTSNHHKDSGRLLTNPLKVHFPGVISPRICIWSFPTLLSYTHSKVGNDQMHIRGEMTPGKWTLSGFVRSRPESLWWFEVDFWPLSVHFRRGPPPFSESTCPRVWAQKVWEWSDVYSRRMGP